MYGIFTYICVIFGVNVGKYSVHGASGSQKHPTSKPPTERKTARRRPRRTRPRPSIPWSRTWRGPPRTWNADERCRGAVGHGEMPWDGKIWWTSWGKHGGYMDIWWTSWGNRVFQHVVAGCCGWILLMFLCSIQLVHRMKWAGD